MRSRAQSPWPEALSGEVRVISVLGRPAPAHPMFAFGSCRVHVDNLRDEEQSRLQDALGALAVPAWAEPIAIEVEPADVLLDQSEQLGLLVVGSRAYGLLRRVLLGSVADALLDRAACPVMILPRGVQHPFAASSFHALPARSH